MRGFLTGAPCIISARGYETGLDGKQDLPVFLISLTKL